MDKTNDRALSKEEHTVLNDLIKNLDLVIKKTNKGNNVVILNKKNYISKMKIALKCRSKFRKLSIEKIKVLNFVLYVLIMSRTRFRVNPHSIFACMSRNSLLETGAISEV